MPAPIVIAYNEPDFLAAAEQALTHAGYEIAAFTDATDALKAIEADGRCQLVVSSADFGAGRQTGLSLVRMVQFKKPGVQAILLGDREHQDYVDENIPFLFEPVQLPDLLNMLGRLLG